MQHEGINHGNWKEKFAELLIVLCKFHFPVKLITLCVEGPLYLRQSLLEVQDRKTKQGPPWDGKGTFSILVGFLANYKTLMTFKGNLPPSVSCK